MTRAIVFDDGKGLLSPLTDLRAAFDVRTGAFTTLERFRRWLDVAGFIVPEGLAALTRERHGLPTNELLGGGGERVLLVSGRAPLAADLAEELRPGEAVWDSDGGADGGAGDLIMANVAADRAAAVIAGDRAGLSDARARLASGAGGREGAKAGARMRLMSRPWHVRSMRDACLKEDLDWTVQQGLRTHGWPQLTPGVLCIGTEPWFVAPSARVFPGVVLDFTAGPILVDDHAVVRPGAVLCGPCFVGPHATVMDRAVIRGGTSIGPWCKVGGEVGGTIFQGYANKAHDGYLGDSWVGEWVNLGAGTTNSNLLNTYGEVIARATPDGSNERTGEQFLGAMIGDHVKTAICTRIMTGAVIGTGTMWAASAPVSGCVGAFSWVTDEGQRTFRSEKFVEVAKAAMGRRKVEASQAYWQAIPRLAAGSG